MLFEELLYTTRFEFDFTDNGTCCLVSPKLRNFFLRTFFFISLKEIFLETRFLGHLRSVLNNSFLESKQFVYFV